MITIIRYRDDSYFGIEGKVKQPSRTYSGHTKEDLKLEKWYNEQMKEFSKKKEEAVCLNKVHVKKALHEEIPDWQKKFKSELEDIEYKLNYVHAFSGFDQLWKKNYTFYHLNNTSIEDLTKPMN